MKQKLIIATHNQKKGQEIIDILHFYGLSGQLYTDSIARQKFPLETTTSYLQNAKTKAEFISEKMPTATVIADDSGLELAAYPNRYGVQTARELRAECPAGDLNEYLINLVRNKNRQFTMKTTIVLARAGKTAIVAHGLLQGTIAEHERGANSNGFDRIFIPNGQSKTLAEMGTAIRYRFLHRARAIKNMLDQLNPEVTDH